VLVTCIIIQNGIDNQILQYGFLQRMMGQIAAYSGISVNEEELKDTKDLFGAAFDLSSATTLLGVSLGQMLFALGRLDGQN